MLPEQQQRIMELFIEEAKEHLATIEQCFMSLQSTLDDPEQLNEVFRAAHSIKGGAAMLGIHSMQHIAHRLEDYFKILKESPVQVDQQIESQFLKVFDALQELTLGLQGTFGLSEDVTATIMAEVEPIFEELGDRLRSLPAKQPSTARQDPRTVPTTGRPTELQEESALQLIFQSDVTAMLREMLQLFKRPPQPENQKQLQEICRSLAQAGDQFDLRKWGELIETASAAIANPQNTYGAIASPILKEIKRAQELVLAGAAHKIDVSPQLKALQPAASKTQPDLQTSVPPSTRTQTTSKRSSRDKATKTPVGSLGGSGKLPIGGNWSTETAQSKRDDRFGGQKEESGTSSFSNSPSPFSKRTEHAGPEVGIAELNSLADLFEGDTPELDKTWETEEVTDAFDDEYGSAKRLREAGPELIESTETESDLDFSTSDFSDLLFDDANSSPEAQPQPEIDDLNSLFGGALLDEELGGASDFSSQFKQQPSSTSTNLSENTKAKSQSLSGGEKSAPATKDNRVLASEPKKPENQSSAAPQDNWEARAETLEQQSSTQEDFRGFSEVENLDEFFGNLDENDPTFAADAKRESPSSYPVEDDLESALFGEPNEPEETKNFASLSTDNSKDEWSELWGSLEESQLLEQNPVDRGKSSVLEPDRGDNAFNLDRLDETLEFESLFDEEETTGAKNSSPPPSSQPPKTAVQTDDELSDLLAISSYADEDSANSLESSPTDEDFLDALLDEAATIQHKDDENATQKTAKESKLSSKNEPVSSDDFLGLDETINNDLDDLFGESKRENSHNQDNSQLAQQELDDFFGLETSSEAAIEKQPAPVSQNQPKAPVSSVSSKQQESAEFAELLEDFFEGDAENDRAIDAGVQRSPSATASSPQFDPLEANRTDLEFLSDTSAATESLDFSGELEALFDAKPADRSETSDESEDWFETGMASNMELDFAAAFATEATPPEKAFDPFETAEAASEEKDSLEFLNSLFDGTEENSSDAAPAIEEVVLTPQEIKEFAKLEALLIEKPEATLIALANTSDEQVFSELENLLSAAPKLAPTAPPVAPLKAAAPAVSSKIEDNEFDELEKLLLGFDTSPDGKAPKQRPGPGAQMKPGQKVLEQNMRVPIKQLDNLSNLVGELVVNRNSLEQDQERLRQFLDNLLHQVTQLSDVGQRMQDLYERSLLEIALLTSRQMRAQGYRDNHASGTTLDALEMDRFTGFHIFSQEIIELIVRVRESASDIEFLVDEADQVTRQLRQVTTQLQEGLTRARMVSFAQTTDRLYRSVRDVAVKEGKQAELQVEGRDIQIDKMIADQLFTPLNHLVNNAIAHGIESPEVRKAAGKPPMGRLTIRAFHQGNQTVISFSDDGAGIDPDRVRAKAIEKRLITPAQAKNMSRQEIYDLLFEPNFSTKDQANDIAGRGVGLNAVLDKINEIRGVITTDSNLGKGTTFTIRLPLMLSISKALVCISDRARIAFPMDGVEDMLDVPRDRVQTSTDGKLCIPWRDSVLQFRHLRDLLGYNRHLGRGNVYGTNPEEDVISVVVLRTVGSYLALQVDQVLGEQEIVIKQLEGPVPKPVGVAGATVMGDGRIVAIADVLELIDLAAGRLRRESGSALWDEATSPIAQEAPPEKNEPTVLIVDDSITVRELLSMTFNKSGYRVEQARDGQEAWEKLRSGLPCDIVFCDIEMPRMDGLELLSRMQKDPVLTELPIAMLTSRGADRHRQMAIQLGARGYFTKPYLEEALLEAASRMLRGEVLVTAKAEV